MSQAINNLSLDPSQLTIKEKVEIFEKSSHKNENLKPLTYFNNFALVTKPNVSSSDNNVSSNLTTSTTTNNQTTSTPLSSGQVQSYADIKQKSYGSINKNIFKSSSQTFASKFPNKLTDTINRIIHDHKTTTSYYNSPESRVEDSSVNMKEFHDAIKDLDSFLAKELNEIEIQKRIGLTNKEKYMNDAREMRYGEKILESLQQLKSEINGIKEQQKGFEEKIRKQEEFQLLKLNSNSSNNGSSSKSSILTTQSSLKAPSKDNVLKKTVSNIEKQNPKENVEISRTITNPKNTFDSPSLAASGSSRDERIRKLEAEIYKEETLMMKINRVLENLKNIDDKNLLDIVNIERHYLVASTRFQSALIELRKLNEGAELAHLPPYNRKGRLLIRDIILEVKSSYFQRIVPIKNEFLLILMKYEDKVYATKPMRIIDDVRTIKFTEKFSIPEIYLDFDMRLEIFGTTFWRKSSMMRETMLKKYGFVTFSLADTGNKSKRFDMIEVMQSENVPIRNKILMKISQKITANVRYKGNLLVKLKDTWYEAFGTLNGHLLEISFKKTYNSEISQLQETILLDLYNVDNDAVIPVDVQRISDKPYTFLLKFNHYVDVANFFLMLAAESSEGYSEWISALNKVLILIK